MFVGKDRSVSSVRCFVSSEKNDGAEKVGQAGTNGKSKGCICFVRKNGNHVANVLLIDDIYTTGATVEQAAKILKKAGAQNVYFLTISIGQGI